MKVTTLDHFLKYTPWSMNLLIKMMSLKSKSFSSLDLKNSKNVFEIIFSAQL